jgi:hypothetical protein
MSQHNPAKEVGPPTPTFERPLGASNRVLHLRGLLQQFRALTKDIGEDTPLEEVVSTGREVWRFYHESQAVANKCKEIVREEAGGTPGKHLFTGRDNAFCQVVVPEPVPVMRAGLGTFQIRDLEDKLGTDLFHLLFAVRQTVKPRKNFGDQMAKLEPDKASIALNAVDTFTASPRVSFDKR